MVTRPSATQPNAPESVVALPGLWLYFVYPPELAGQSVKLAHGLVFGRAPAADSADESVFAIPHATVSRRHAMVQLAFGVPILRDLGSSNGTRVDGQLLSKPAALAQQAVVRFGDTLAIVDESAGLNEANETCLLGQAPSILRLQDTVQRVARETAPVLVTGETGTGKEWLAADIHRLSGRTGPYLKLNCAELSPDLVESELFGHEKGAFTGASAKHVGLFVAAAGGTLFLDEIFELPLALQAKLLRVLQEREVRPVGSTKTEPVDVRVVSATHADLAQAVEQGAFRRDLYARLAFFELAVPALRERRQDIFEWVHYFCERFASERGRRASIQFQPPVAERIVLHAWRDNLRGIDRLVQRALTVEDDVTVGQRLLAEVMPELCAELEPGSKPPAAEQAGAESSVSAVQVAEGVRANKAKSASPVSERPTREEFLAVYEATGRSVRATSKHFGRDRRQIYRWLESFGVER